MNGATVTGSDGSQTVRPGEIFGAIWTKLATVSVRRF